MKSFSMHFLMTALIVAAALLAYDRIMVHPAQLVGVVDVGEVYRMKEAQFAQIVTRSTSEVERQKALALARQFAQRLPLALEELPRDCHCLVLVRTAVAGSAPHAVDLTPLLKHKVDLP